jgi:hypothetical protein
MMSAPKQKPLREETAAALEEHNATGIKSTTAAFTVVVINRHTGKRMLHRRFLSYAGALAEARHLREQGVAAAVEPPAS